MIEVRLKVPSSRPSIFIPGNLDDKFIRRVASELSSDSDQKIFVSDVMIVEQNERAPYDMDFKNAKKGGKVLIPISNIAYMKDIEEI